MERDPAGRPVLDGALSALVAELAAGSPAQLGHLDPSRILFVAGAARRDARASVRPLRFAGGAARAGGFVKPSVTIGGALVLYEICLRPRFFLGTTLEERMLTLAHELWHVSTAFDGTLAEDRRHVMGADFEAEVSEIVAAWSPSPAGELLATRGEMRLRAWCVRPPTRVPNSMRGVRLAYDERDLFSSVVVGG